MPGAPTSSGSSSTASSGCGPEATVWRPATRRGGRATAAGWSAWPGRRTEAPPVWIGRAPGGTRVRTAVHPCPARHTRGGPTRCGHRAHRRRRGTAGADADHPSPQRVPVLPLDVRDDHAPEHGAPAHGRARRTARPIGPFRGSMDEAELCHDLLEHRWCMSERAQGYIGCGRPWRTTSPRSFSVPAPKRPRQAVVRHPSDSEPGRAPCRTDPLPAGRTRPAATPRGPARQPSHSASRGSPGVCARCTKRA